tara:strand:+ start:269 stop:541 length:273 start_codon:yes stop_codon:yes gene_type:complete
MSKLQNLTSKLADAKQGMASNAPILAHTAFHDTRQPSNHELWSARINGLETAIRSEHRRIDEITKSYNAELENCTTSIEVAEVEKAYDNL